MRAADDEALGDDDLKQLTLASMFSDLRRYVCCMSRSCLNEWSKRNMAVCFFSSIELRKAQDTHDARAAETKRRAAAVLKQSQEKIAKVTALWCDVLQVCR